MGQWYTLNTTAMQAVKASSITTSRFPTFSKRSPAAKSRNPIISFSSSSKPISPFSSAHQKISKYKACSTSSPTSPTAPSSPDAELVQGDVENFDWYSHWYPIAGVCDLDKRVPHARRVMGIDIVVWWDRNKEKWQVFDDSCPHRLAPLSEGRIDQWGRLQCVYHGWCFNGSGDCKFIPQAPPDGPQVHTSKKACATAYPCVLQNKIVWFWARTEPLYKDIATMETPPYFPELDDPSYSSSLLSRDFPFGYEVLMENLMDPAHVPYAHHGIARPSRKPREKADREGGMPLEIIVTELDKNGFLARLNISCYKFMAPCLLTYFPSPESDEGLFTSGSIQKKISKRRALLILMCIPVSPGKSRLLFTFPRNFALWIDQVIPRWILHIRSNLLLDSDLYLLHLEERKLNDMGVSNWHKACFVPTKSDANVIAFRKWLKKYSGGQIPWGAKFGSELPPTPPKDQLMDRYWSHVVNCSSCSKAVNRLKILEVVLQVISIASIGIVATRQSVMSSVAKIFSVSLAVLCIAVSRWLSHFIYKTFYFHDYNHAFR